ncbi:MAG: ROK family protein [Streptosporangiales bacterium]|nr:ROK family protein [Streptosporangiales bacterium]
MATTLSGRKRDVSRESATGIGHLTRFTVLGTSVARPSSLGCRTKRQGGDVLDSGSTAGPVPADQRNVRRHNLGLVMRSISVTGWSTRARLATATGLTKATVSSLAGELIEAGLLTESGAQAKGATGRPGSVLEVNRQGHAGIGLEINVDYVAACVTDLGHRVRYHRVECVDNRTEHTASLNRLARMASAALRAAEEFELTPQGIAVAVPGIVEPERGRLLRAPNLDWTDLPIVDLLAERLGLAPTEIWLDNEANLAALGVLWFAGGSAWGDFVYVSSEIGVGAGIVTDGQMYRGARGFAGEIGHVSIDPSGEPCGCGGRGCIERYCGQEAILRSAGLPTDTATSTGNPDGPVTELLAALEREEQRAVRAVRRAGEALGVGLANVINVIDPDTVVLGGIFTPLAPWLVEPLTAALAGQAIAAPWSPPRVAVSSLGPEAAVRGAAGLVIEQMLSDPARITRSGQGLGNNRHV